MPLTSLEVTGNDRIDSLEPLTGMPLEILRVPLPKLQDVSPFRDMPLKSLYLDGCKLLEDIEPLATLRSLERLQLGGTRVRSLKPLEGLSLTTLNLNLAKRVESLEPLREMKSLKRLLLLDCGERLDLSPLKGLQLEYIALFPHKVQNIEALRDMKSLKTFQIHFQKANLSRQEFWKQFDAGKFRK
jgi:internalin A